MIGGKIKDFFIKERISDSYIVRFLVVDHLDTCTVTAEIPKDAIDFKMIKEGQPIWWHNPKVLIKIEETQDVPFRKVGNSSNSDNYYKEKQQINNQ
jgi:hypothetical protein